MKRIPLLLLPALLATACATANSADAGKTAATTKEVASFVSRMSSEHDFDAGWLSDLLAGAERREDILEAISRPAEKAKPWHEYRKIFVNEKRIAAGIRFWQEHRETLEAIACEYGVPPRIIVAIIGVETHYGRITGRYKVLDSLSTLGFHYPPRSKFFLSELEQFLLLTREESVDPKTAIGSYAGAMGAPQFISSSYRRYSVDHDGDGRRDLWNNWEDVLASVANYFSVHGWQQGGPVFAAASLSSPEAVEFKEGGLNLDHHVADLLQGGVDFISPMPDSAGARLIELEGSSGMEYWVGFQNFYVITRYNRSRMYAMAVHQLAEALAAGMQNDAS